MEISVKCPIFGCLLLVLLPMLCSSQDNFVYSRATYYGSPDCYGTPCMPLSILPFSVSILKIVHVFSQFSVVFTSF